MTFYVLTLFPDMINDAVNHSILKKSIENGIVNVNAINIRDFSNNKHKKTDDYPYGGGCGMVMAPEPIYNSYLSIKDKINTNTKVIYLSPQGAVFNQQLAQSLSKEQDLVLLCGHYEGVDERIIEEIVTDEICIGDYILTGGELPALILIDAVSRLIDGVLGSKDSSIDESFSNNLLEYPQYTRPQIFKDKKVPDVLLSGNHKEIKKWRYEQSLIRTKKKRPDLLE